MLKLFKCMHCGNIIEMVEDKIQELMIDRNIFIYARRGLAFNDRLYDDGKKGLTYDKVRGLVWTGEVYKVIQQLEFMERLDPYQYYSRWLQAKIGRLEETQKYKREDLEELKRVYRTYFEIKEQKKGNKVKEKE